MNQRLQEKLAKYKAIAKKEGKASAGNVPAAGPADGLSKVIHSKKDADDFMAALNGVKRASK